MPDSSHPPKKTPINRPAPEDVERCHAAGMSKNKTAETLGVSTRQVGYVADELGLSWSATATAEAVAARKQQAELERLDLADSWRELAVDSVARALLEEESAAERRRFAMTAESATRSDLAIWARGLEQVTDKDTEAEKFAEMLMALRQSFAVLEAIPDDVLDPDGEFDYYGTPGEEPP